MKIEGQTRFGTRGGTRADETPAGPSDEAPPAVEGTPRQRSRTELAAFALVAVIVVVAVGAAVQTLYPATPDLRIQTTYYGVSASTVVSSATEQNQAGYVLESSGPRGGGTQLVSWAVLGNSAGSTANITALVYPSISLSQGYYNGTVAGLKGLPGYQDVSSDLASYQQYGRCYAYGEDVDTIAVVNGICYKANVVLQVHLVSGVDFTTLQSDLGSLMGTMYSVTQ
jgi:hypothetical protein